MEMQRETNARRILTAGARRANCEIGALDGTKHRICFVVARAEIAGEENR